MRRLMALVRAAAAGLALAAAATVAAAQTIEPEADRLLRAMSDHLAGIPVLRAVSDASLEVMLRDGRKIQLTATSTVLVDRARGFRFERQGPRGLTTMVWDGAAVHLANAELGAHLSIPVEGGMDAALDEVRTVLGTEATGGADLLYANPYEGLLYDVESGQYLGEAIIAGQRAHHLSFRLAEIDWQLWIAATGDPLPIRYVITSKWLAGAPQFIADFSGWEFPAAPGPEAFTFTPPPGSRAVSPDDLGSLDILVEK